MVFLETPTGGLELLMLLIFCFCINYIFLLSFQLLNPFWETIVVAKFFVLLVFKWPWCGSKHTFVKMIKWWVDVSKITFTYHGELTIMHAAGAISREISLAHSQFIYWRTLLKSWSFSIASFRFLLYNILMAKSLILKQSKLLP